MECGSSIDFWKKSKPLERDLELSDLMVVDGGMKATYNLHSGLGICETHWMIFWWMDEGYEGNVLSVS